VFIDFVLNKRPLVVAIALVVLALGVYAAKILPLEAYPDIANLQVRVITQIPGKAAEEMERLVTVPLEKELNGIPHADPPRSITIFGLSVITVTFDDAVPSFVARSQVLEKISQADIPSNIQPTLDPDASPVGEVFRYTVQGSHYNPMARKEWQDWYLERKFKSVKGVVDVTGFGGPTKTFQVELDPDRMRALGITQAQVVNAISSSNGSTGGGYIIESHQDYMVRGLGLLTSVDDIENVVVASSKEGLPILMRSIATVEVGPKIRLGQVGVNDDDDAVEGIVLMRRGENPSTTVDHLKEAWSGIAEGLPSGMHLVPLYDRMALVHKTMDTIEHNVGEGIFMVVVMMMFYLFQVRAAFICSAVIPMALCTALIMLNVFGVSGNLLSLGAIDFGILVDGAIIMVENIVRHLAHASKDGRVDKRVVIPTIATAAKEVFKPILFATSIIFVTFLPILTFEKVEGKLFRPLAWTMNLTLLGAVLTTVSLIPVLCATVYSKRPPKERESPVMTIADKIYQPLLKLCIANKLAVVAFATTLLVLTGLITPMLGAEFIPELEEGNIWLRVTILPTSVALEKSVTISHELRDEIRKFPECTNIVTQVGTPDDGTDPNNYSNIEVFVDLKPKEEWESKYRTKQDLVNDMNKTLSQKMPGLLFNWSQYIKDNMDEAIAGVKGELGIKIYGKDLKVLRDLGNQVKQIVDEVPGMADVACDQLLGQPQVLVTIDRQEAARYGINTQDILDIVETSIGGKTITELIEGERRFAVVLRFKKDYRQDLALLGNIQVSTPGGLLIPLAQLATISEGHGATSILREKNQRRVAIKANIRGRDMVGAVQDAQKRVAEKVHFPEDYVLTWEGQFERAQHAMMGLLVVIPVTLCLIFILLYAATNSVRIASLVMLCVPLALPGAIFALWITHTHFSISAGVGLIALFGVSCQNGVILVSLVRNLVAEGYTLADAVYRSAVVRMKPALMTSTVAMAGLIPAAMSTGIGSQSQKPIAIVIVGGLLPSMALALIVLPTLYEFFETYRRTNEPDLTKIIPEDYDPAD
jgi:cobalt-zinc-cadmium resistance protein CzcA